MAHVTSTFSPDAHPESATVDGSVARDGVNQAFAAVRAGAGTDSVDNAATITVGIRASTTTNQIQEIRRARLYFNTAAIPDDVPIHSVTLRLYIDSVTTTLADNNSEVATYSVVSVDTISSDTSLANSDYAIAGYDVGDAHGSIASDAISAGAYNEIDVSDMAHLIDRGGITYIGLLNTWDFDALFDTDRWSSGDWENIVFQSADGANAPELVVTYFEHDRPLVDPAEEIAHLYDDKIRTAEHAIHVESRTRSYGDG